MAELNCGAFAKIMLGEQTKKPGPGHPSMDVSFVIRNWGWYLLARKDFANLSHSEIDRRFKLVQEKRLPGEKSVIADMQKYARDPTNRINAITWQSEELSSAREWYGCALWDLLEDKNKSHADYQSIISTELARREINNSESILVEAFGPDAVRGLRPDLSRPPDAITSGQPLDNVMILCAMFREQHLNYSRRYSPIISAILRNEIARLRTEPPFTLPFQFSLFDMLDFLIEDRILNNLWVLKDNVLKRRFRPELNTRPIPQKAPDPNDTTTPAGEEVKPDAISVTTAKVAREKDEEKLHRYVRMHLQGSPETVRYSQRPILRKY